MQSHREAHNENKLHQQTGLFSADIHISCRDSWCAALLLCCCAKVALSRLIQDKIHCYHTCISNLISYSSLLITLFIPEVNPDPFLSNMQWFVWLNLMYAVNWKWLLEARPQSRLQVFVIELCPVSRGLCMGDCKSKGVSDGGQI